MTDGFGDLFGAEPDEATPLEDDEREGLIPSWIATRGDLNRAEQANITKARLSLRRRRLSVQKVLDDRFAKKLHRDMFGDVWTWAGLYRKTERNIGVPVWGIAVDVHNLMADALLWTIGDKPMKADEAAIRLHHRLVAIHPFPNGNGRHSREMTDLFLRCLGEPAFTWGSATLVEAGATRDQYIRALRAADRLDYGPLGAFVRS